MKNTSFCRRCGASLSGRHWNAKYCFPCFPLARFESGKTMAHRAVMLAVRTGKLAHPSTHKCSDCGAQAAEYDHRDYNKPLEVDPVCRRCNLHRGPAIPFKPVELAA